MQTLASTTSAADFARVLCVVVLLPVIAFACVITVDSFRRRNAGRTLAWLSWAGILAVNAIGVIQRFNAPLSWRIPAITVFAVLGLVGAIKILRSGDYFRA